MWKILRLLQPEILLTLNQHHLFLIGWSSIRTRDGPPIINLQTDLYNLPVLPMRYLINLRIDGVVTDKLKLIWGIALDMGGILD